MTNWWLASVAVAAAWFPSAAPAVALQCSTAVGGGFDDNRVLVRGSAECPGGPVDSGPRLRAERTVRSDNLCIGVPDGLLETIRYFDVATNELVRTAQRCIGPNVPSEPAPPPAPSTEEVLALAHLPQPEVHLSPPTAGLVGFETWLWWGADTDLDPLGIRIGDWSVTLDVAVHELEWDLGNGDRITSSGAGTAHEPAARYVYTSSCTCDITLRVRWSGQLTLTHGPTGTVERRPVGTASFSAATTYPVVEREAVIVG